MADAKTSLSPEIRYPEWQPRESRIEKLTLLIASEHDDDIRRRLLSELHCALRSEQAAIKKNVDEFVKRYPVVLLSDR